MNNLEQINELLSSAAQALDRSVHFANYQVLGNADELQSRIRREEAVTESLIEAMVKQPTRRHIGLLRASIRMLDELRRKIENENSSCSQNIQEKDNANSSKSHL